jgi:hypothetical protein
MAGLSNVVKMKGRGNMKSSILSFRLKVGQRLTTRKEHMIRRLEMEAKRIN